MPHQPTRAQRLEVLYELRDVLERFIARAESVLRLVLAEIGRSS